MSWLTGRNDCTELTEGDWLLNGWLKNETSSIFPEICWQKCPTFWHLQQHWNLLKFTYKSQTIASSTTKSHRLIVLWEACESSIGYAC